MRGPISACSVGARLRVPCRYPSLYGFSRGVGKNKRLNDGFNSRDGDVIGLPDQCQVANGVPGYSVGDGIYKGNGRNLLLSSFSTSRVEDRTRAFVLPIVATPFAFIAALCAIATATSPPTRGRNSFAAPASLLCAAIAWIMAASAFACIVSLYNDVRRAMPSTFGFRELEQQLAGNIRYAWYPRTSLGTSTWCLLGAFVALVLGSLMMLPVLFLQRRAVREPRGVDSKPGPVDEYAMGDRHT
jgi:hypothetical protein